MQTIASRPGSYRWVGVLILVGLLISLCLAAIPGAPVWVLMRHAELMRLAQQQDAAMNAVRAAFFRARRAERDVATGPAARKEAVTRVRRALVMFPNDTKGSGVNAAALLAAMENYELAFTTVVASPQSGLPSPGQIDRVLGQLDAADEAMLRKSLTDLRVADEAFMSGTDPRSAARVARAEALFSARLAEAAIPAGTRIGVTARLADWERGFRTENEDVPALWQDAQEPGEAARSVERVLDDTDRALAADRNGQIDTFEAALKRIGLFLGFGLLASVVLTIGGGFGWGFFHREPRLRVSR